jgi:hypothetical protein
MKQSHISRRSFLYQASSFALTLFAGQSLAQTAKFPSVMQLGINFEIVAPGGFRYKPPYVAVWLENSQGLPVHTLALWFEQSNKGPRWLNELKRWYRSGKLESTVSSPTRLPGKYALAWDGKDDKGNLVNQGEYYVCIEMAREHGPYQLFREKLNLSSSALNRSFTPEGELKTVSLEYAKRS